MNRTNLSPNAQLVLRAMDHASNRNFEAFHEVCAADVLLSFPYHPNGAQSWRGVDALIREFSVEKVFQTFRIDVEDIFDCGDTVIVEGRSHGTYKSGRPPYENHYLFCITCKDGKIVHWNEFFNPLEAMKQNYGKPRPEKKTAEA